MFTFCRDLEQGEMVARTRFWSRAWGPGAYTCLREDYKLSIMVGMSECRDVGLLFWVPSHREVLPLMSLWHESCGRFSWIPEIFTGSLLRLRSQGCLRGRCLGISWSTFLCLLQVGHGRVRCSCICRSSPHGQLVGSVMMNLWWYLPWNAWSVMYWMRQPNNSCLS